MFKKPGFTKIKLCNIRFPSKQRHPFTSFTTPPAKRRFKYLLCINKDY